MADSKRGWLDGMNLYISMWLHDDSLPFYYQGMGRAGRDTLQKGIPTGASIVLSNTRFLPFHEEESVFNDEKLKRISANRKEHAVLSYKRETAGKKDESSQNTARR